MHHILSCLMTFHMLLPLPRMHVPAFPSSAHLLILAFPTPNSPPLACFSYPPEGVCPGTDTSAAVVNQPHLVRIYLLGISFASLSPTASHLRNGDTLAYPQAYCGAQTGWTAWRQLTHANKKVFVKNLCSLHFLFVVSLPRLWSGSQTGILPCFWAVHSAWQRQGAWQLSVDCVVFSNLTYPGWLLFCFFG